eukprot:gene20420-26499_t
MNKNLPNKLNTEHQLSKKDLENLEKEEVSTRKSLDASTKKQGKFSLERANLLHKLGGILYKKKNYAEALTLSEEIVLIHEKIDGVDHENTAKALANVGSVTHRLKKMEYCELVERRALKIFMDKYGLDGKEEVKLNVDVVNDPVVLVLLHRGRMLSFGIPESLTAKGLSYDEYIEEMEYLPLLAIMRSFLDEISRAETSSEIRRLVEYYFGDNAMKTERQLRLASESDDGYVGIDLLLTFSKLMPLTKDINEIVISVSDSNYLALSHDNKRIKRLHSFRAFKKPSSADSFIDFLSSNQYITARKLWRQGIYGSDKEMSKVE